MVPANEWYVSRRATHGGFGFALWERQRSRHPANSIYDLVNAAALVIDRCEGSSVKKTGPEAFGAGRPLLDQLKKLGWKEEQIQYDPEWRVPKNPSEATKREARKSFAGYPVDFAIFDDPGTLGEWEHVLIIVETKAPNEKSGISQLQIYMRLEPQAILGLWTNGTDVAAVYRAADGKLVSKKNAAIPGPEDEIIVPGEKLLHWQDLQSVTAKQLRAVFDRLLNHVVSADTRSTRRDEQLNQLCNLLLLKLESDRRGKANPEQALVFQIYKDEERTERRIRDYFSSTVKLTHGELFAAPEDQDIQLDGSTIHRACYELGSVRVLDTSMDVASAAFQVLRAASLKSEEGQYFTPYPVIRSGVTLLDINYDDKIIDPACGTGGFLIECFRQLRENSGGISESDAKAWAQQHLWGVDKDKINIKLSKSMMMILGDGSAHIYIGDSLCEHLWQRRWPHMPTVLSDESYTCVVTNPPFGEALKIKAADGRQAGLTVSHRYRKVKEGAYEADPGRYEDREIGIVFLERCYRLLVKGGRLGIVLPETYLFSKSYYWLQDWLKNRLLLRGVFNIPMEAFQGFCRAKTSFYIFEKI